MVNFLATRRRYGVLRMLHEIIYKLVQRAMICDITHLMCLDLEHVSLPDKEPENLCFRFITSDEVRRFAGGENDMTPDLAARVELGRDFCFAALAGEHLAAYAWYALGSIEAELNRGDTMASGVAMSFPDNVAFMYKGFTHPNFRGKGLYGYVNAKGLEVLQLHGVSTVVSTADWTNWSALNACWRIGYRGLGLVWRGGWGRFMVTVAPRKGKLLGIRFGKRAVVQPRSQHPLPC